VTRPKSEIRICEAYQHYTPPVNAAAIVHKLLSTVPSTCLKGLDCVILTNEVALSRKDRVGRVWSRRRKFDKSRVLGRYHPGSRSSLPHIQLRVDKIVAGLKGTSLHIPLFREIVFGQVLFHELGHHVHHAIRPEYSEKEDVADTWAKRFIGLFILKKYWYLVPVLKVYRFMRRKRWI
jgi:hypothetical protein